MKMLSRISLTGGLIAAVVVLAVGAVVYVVATGDSTGQGGSGLGERFQYNAEVPRRVDPALIAYRQAGRLETGLSSAAAIAVGPDGRIYVAGDRVIRVFDARGKHLSEIALSGSPRCLSVGPEGKLYVGLGGRLDVLDAYGAALAHWTDLGEGAEITSIAVAGGSVFLADYGQRRVGRYDLDGKLLNLIGPADPALGYVLRSPYFDLAVGADGNLIVANPGVHRVETYTFDGRFLAGWGKNSPATSDFFGCCNPAHLAVFPDGRILTSEKGVPTVKICSTSGELLGVVATAEMLSLLPQRCINPYHSNGLDVAIAGDGRVLVLDPGGNVGIYVAKEGR